MDVRIRQAKLEEMAWINTKYDEVGFVHSDPHREFVAIAESGDAKAGLGRVVQLDLRTAELGGMYVFEEFRGRGIAELIARFLLANSTSYEKVFCLPFAHLAGFYRKFGFEEVATSSVPHEMREKHRWCNQKYDHRTLMFVRSKQVPEFNSNESLGIL